MYKIVDFDFFYMHDNENNHLCMLKLSHKVTKVLFSVFLHNHIMHACLISRSLLL